MRLIRLSFLTVLVWLLTWGGAYSSEVRAQQTSSIDFDKPIVLVHGLEERVTISIALKES